MKYMLKIKRDRFTNKEERNFFSKDDIRDYDFNSFEEIDNSLIREFLKELDFIKLGKTKRKLTDREEIFISGVEVDDSVLNESLNFTEAMKKLDKFENRIV